jgi:hypothetical protein
MPYSRILILGGAACAFLLMLTTVTASSDFMYAPESAWRTSSDARQDVAVAAWRAQTAQSASVTRQASSAPSVSVSSPDAQASSTPAAASSQPASSPAPASSESAVSSAPTVADPLPDWWQPDDKDGGRKGKDKKGRD